MNELLVPHYFLAIPVPEQIANELAYWYESLKALHPFEKWNHPLDLHVTLVFLGSSTQEQLEQIRNHLPGGVGRTSRFSLELSHLDTFGLEERPRIFWAGLKEEPQLYELQSDTKSLMEGIGFSLDNRPYRPHITLGKKWMGPFPFQLPQFPLRGLSWTVDQVVLYSIELDSVPRNKPIQSFRLHST